jgi:4'-phosphopantetheinyl transferase
MDTTFDAKAIGPSSVGIDSSSLISWSVPPARWPLADEEVHVWCSSLEPSPACLQQLTHSLSEDERERAARFYFPKDKDRFIVGRGVLRSILGAYLNLKPSELTFQYSARGKPSLASSAIQFNLAHSGDLVLCAVCRHRELGVDLEKMRPIPELEAIARRFFSPPEANCLLSLPEEQRQEGFFNCWTRKEAYLKATGDGITVALDKFEVSLVPGEPAALLRDKLNPHEVSRWTLGDLKPAAGYAGALAVKGQGAHIRCWQWRTGDQVPL